MNKHVLKAAILAALTLIPAVAPARSHRSSGYYAGRGYPSYGWEGKPSARDLYGPGYGYSPYRYSYRGYDRGDWGYRDRGDSWGFSYSPYGYSVYYSN